MQQYNKKVPFITWILIIICCLVYVIEVLLSHRLSIPSNVMIALGGESSTLVNEQPWRLFTAMWLHWTPYHLLSNMTFLYLTGRIIEDIFGHFRFLMIYLVSGFIGDIAASYLVSPNTVSAGASTALFGIMLAGATLRWTTGAYGYGKSMMELFISNIVMDLFMPNISIMGHLGGAVAGFVLGFILQPKQDEKWYTNFGIQLLICFIILNISIKMI